MSGVLLTPGIFVPGSTAVAVSGAADTNENILGTLSFPSLSANGLIQIVWDASYTNNANNKTWRLRLNGIGGTVIHGPTRTTQLTQTGVLWVHARNAQNAQRYYGLSGNGASTGDGVLSGASTENLAAPFTIVLTATKALGSDTMTLEAIYGQILRP